MTDKLLGKSAFEECTALETIHIEIDDKNNNYENKEKKCFSLPYRAFWGCTALKQIYLSKSVRILEKECFGDCTSKCVLEYEGEAFWFFGENAISKIEAFYYWESMVSYKMKSTTLSRLLEEHGIKRDQYIKVTLNIIHKWNNISRNVINCFYIFVDNIFYDDILRIIFCYIINIF
jgi:hypothetical protein